MNASLIGSLISGGIGLLSRGLGSLSETAGGDNQRKTGWLAVITSLAAVVVPEGSREGIASLLLTLSQALSG